MCFLEHDCIKYSCLDKVNPRPTNIQLFPPHERSIEITCANPVGESVRSLICKTNVHLKHGCVQPMKICGRCVTLILSIVVNI